MRHGPSEAAVTGAEGPIWETPDRLPDTAPTAPFDASVLGDLELFAESVAEETGTPVDMAALVILGVCSTLIAGSVEVDSSAWREPTNLYIACLAAPGEGKTPVMRRCVPVLDVIEAGRRDRLMPEIHESRTRLRVAGGRRKQADAAAADLSRTDNPQALQEALEAAEQECRITVPVAPRVYTREATPEGLVKLLGEQGGRVGVVTDEGVEFFELSSRYSSSGRANLGIYLTGWDGGRYTSDRAGRESIAIERTTLTVCLLAQPVVLGDLAKDRQAIGRGLLARFLWSAPGSLVGRRSIQRQPVPDPLLANYNNRMIGLSQEAEALSGQPISVGLTRDAVALFDTWRTRHEPRLDPTTGDLSGLVEWASKLPGQVLRLAGNLHAIRTGTIHGNITEETMAAALAAASYFTSHATRVFGMMRTDPEAADASLLQQWLSQRACHDFSVREVSKSKGWGPDRVRTAARFLGQSGWVRELTHHPGKGGRPSERWEVHPDLWAKTSQKDEMIGVLGAIGGLDAECDFGEGSLQPADNGEGSVEVYA